MYATRQLADYLKLPCKAEIFIAALMHDIGKLVLLQKLPDWYLRIIKEVERYAKSFRKIGFRVLNFDHTDVAAVLLSSWDSPQVLIEAIKYHHEQPSFRQGAEIPLAQLINLGNYMAKNLDIVFNDEKFDELAGIGSAQAIGLDSTSLDGIFKEAKAHYRAELQILESEYYR